MQLSGLQASPASIVTTVGIKLQPEHPVMTPKTCEVWVPHIWWAYWVPPRIFPILVCHLATHFSSSLSKSQTQPKKPLAALNFFFFFFGKDKSLYFEFRLILNYNLSSFCCWRFQYLSQNILRFELKLLQVWYFQISSRAQKWSLLAALVAAFWVNIPG